MSCRRILLILSVANLLLLGCQSDSNRTSLEAARVQQAESWNAAGQPERFTTLGEDYNYKLSELPTSGMAAQETWAGWYWATWKDAINFKWDGSESDSPTAKYAKAFGIDPVALENAVSKQSGIDSRFRATECTEDSECNSDVGEKCAKRDGQEQGKCIPTWFGQCHAWAPAAVMEPEPKEPVTINGVTFKAQDIKALMTYVYNNVRTDFLGGRCNSDDDDVSFDEFGRPVNRVCRDINPGTLHVILTNWLGIHKKAIVEDRTWDDEVWNQPVRGFEITKLDEVSKSSAAVLVGAGHVGGTTVSESATVNKDEWKHYGPYESENGISVRMTGTGDADLYVRRGAEPTASEFDCRPYGNSSAEKCNVEGSGQFYVSVLGYSDTNEVDVNISYGGAADYIFNADAEKFYHVMSNVKYITESGPSEDGNLDEDRYTRDDAVEYILEVDADGNIVGGEWIKKNLFADFLWVPTHTAGDYYVGYYVFEYKKVKDLLNKSISGEDTEEDTDSDTEEDTDSDTGDDTEEDTDTDTGNDIEEDTDSDTGVDIEEDTDSDTGVDIEEDTDSDTGDDIDEDTDSDIEEDTDRDIEEDTDRDIDVDTDDDSTPNDVNGAVCNGDYVVSGEEDVTGIGNCSQITGNLTIENSSLTHLNGLKKLMSVGGKLKIKKNSRLSNIDGLTKITDGVKTIEIDNNGMLEDLSGLANLTSVGELKIKNNQRLRTLEALTQLTKVGKKLEIVNNDALTSLSGLDNLTSVRELKIKHNSLLADISALGNVTSEVKKLEIEGNDVLASLDGLTGITYLGGKLKIVNNPSLPTCEAENFADTVIPTGGMTITTITGNDDSGICE